MVLILIEFPSPNVLEYMCLVILSRGPHVDKMHAKAFKRLYFLMSLKIAGVEENEWIQIFSRVFLPSWSTGINKGQFDSLEQIQKHAKYIIAPYLQYKEAITKFNLPTIKDCLDILNSTFCRHFVDNDSHRLHYFLPKPRAVKKTLCSTSKYEPPKCCTNRFKTNFIPQCSL